MKKLIIKIISYNLLLSVLVSSYSWSGENKVLFVSGTHSNKAKVSLIKKMASDQYLIIDQRSVREIKDLESAGKLFSDYSLIIFDDSSKRSTSKSFLKYAPIIKNLDIKSVAITWPDSKELGKGLTNEQAEILTSYYDNGGKKNFSRMIQYLNNRVFAILDNPVEDPIVFPNIGIYHPQYNNLIFPSLDEYQSWKKLQPIAVKKGDRVVGLMLQRSLIESAQTGVVDAAINLLESRGVDVIPFFFELAPVPSDYTPLIQKDGKTLIDVAINFRTIHWANKRKAEFEKMNVPIMQALTYYDGDQQAWESSTQGISAGMMAFTLVLPETAGVIDPTIVAAINQESHRAEVIDYQLEYLIDRALGYAALVKKKNSEKKLTVMFWGDQDMGASFLNVPESLGSISTNLNKAGYSIKSVDGAYFTDRIEHVLDPFYREYQLDKLLKDDLAELLPVADYRKWLTTLPEKVAKDIADFWGEPEDNFMVIDKEEKKYFVIPRIRNGNMLVMRQPPRGDDADQEKSLFHKTTIPMNHYYLAAYYYAREYWNSDAIIHLGTHGSHEYLPGKERGLSRYDGGNLAAGAVPIMYPFIVDDVGEAMQTKRRGNAVVVSHMTPPFASAGLQGITTDIHELMHQYKSLDEGGVKQKTGKEIARLCINENLCDDFGWTIESINADFDTFLEILHDYLGELAAENQPLGLHTFGELSEMPLLISTIVQMLGSEYIESAGDFEKEFYLHSGQHQPHDHHEDEGEPGHHHEDEDGHDHHDEEGEKGSNEHNHEEGEGHFASFSTTELHDLPGFKLIRDFVVEGKKAIDLPDDIRGYLELGRGYYDNMQGIREMDNLLAGLSGQYIPAKTGGDPIRNPESMPTGLNLFGFDPSRLPTKAAYEQGKELTVGVIDDFYKEHGRYPDKLAFSLWSIEAMRHYGVLESQALYAMGVEPVWSDDGRVIDTKIIPYSELKRPRVDVVLSATGLYRDAFPNVMQRLAGAIQQVAELKEEGNSLWENSQRIKKDLMAEGMDEEEAQYLSTVRIFSNASGDYGSGVDGPIFESDSWETDASIADTYLSKMGYYFGADDTRWGKQSEGLYGKQLSGTDVALFSRSSNLYGMITSDDPFEYFGSIALAVRNLDGASPEMKISNLRDASDAKMENASTFMARELRSRNFNQRWIEEMQKEGYSGAVAMSSSLTNFWGWQVVDPNIVRDDQWQEFYEVYIEDKLDLNMDEWFEEVNPKSQAQMIERMLEATRKEYWPADDKVQQKLIERYQELVNKYDLLVDNEKLSEYITQQGAGYGLNVTLPAPEVPATPEQDSQAAPTEQVAGQQLEKVEETNRDNEQDWTLWYLFAGCLLILLAGVATQARRRG